MEKVLLGMSGGIDSSVAAYLLKEKGLAVEGVFFILFDEPENIEFAQRTAEHLKIKLHIEDLREEFSHNVISPFFEGYKQGITPNPCILCNRRIKFPSLMKISKKIGAKFISTGHYARVESSEKGFLLKKGVDEKKDQSYFLYGIDRDILSHVLFPLGEFTKSKVREIAENIGIPSLKAKESTEVCFLKQRRYYEKIRQSREGAIIELKTGKILGHHRGVHLYTIGQRKRLGIAYSHPLYVIKIDSVDNIIYVGSREEAYGKEFIVESLNWLYDLNEREFLCKVKIRYAMNPENARVELINSDRVRVTFSEPQFAPTPGQSAVFYLDDLVIGGGVIKEIMQGS